jgi:hypothetical protein
MGVNNFDTGALYLGDVKIGEVQDITFTTENYTDYIHNIENNINCFNDELEINLIDGNRIANLLEVNFKRAYRKGRR